VLGLSSPLLEHVVGHRPCGAVGKSSTPFWVACLLRLLVGARQSCFMTPASRRVTESCVLPDSAQDKTTDRGHLAAVPCFIGVFPGVRTRRYLSEGLRFASVRVGLDGCCGRRAPVRHSRACDRWEAAMVELPRSTALSLAERAYGWCWGRSNAVGWVHRWIVGY
jgi:hypothetical protein